MTTMRIFTWAFFAVGATAALWEVGCSLQSVPDDRQRQMEAQRAEYQRQLEADREAGDKKREEQRQRILANPGSLSIEESDAEIAALHSSSSLRRTSAAEKLGDAKGARAVEALVADLRTRRRLHQEIAIHSFRADIRSKLASFARNLSNEFRFSRFEHAPWKIASTLARGTIVRTPRTSVCLSS